MGHRRAHSALSAAGAVLFQRAESTGSAGHCEERERTSADGPIRLVDSSGRFSRETAICDGKPWVDVVAGKALAAFQDLHPLVNRLVVDLGLRGPPAGQIRELCAPLVTVGFG